MNGKTDASVAHEMEAPTDWAGLVRLEPRLAGLARWAACGGGWRTWGNITASLRRLVGWDAARPELGTADAYETAYRYLSGLFEQRRRKRGR